MIITGGIGLRVLGQNEHGEYNLVKKHPVFIHHSSTMNKGLDEFKTEVKL